MVYVKIVCSDPEISYDGEWENNKHQEAILEEMKEKAKKNGIPIMITFDKMETFSISSGGQMVRGALFDIDKVKGVRGKRKSG